MHRIYRLYIKQVILLCIYALIINFFTTKSLFAKTQVYYAGFSFGSVIPESTYTNTLLEKGAVSFLDKLLISETKKISNNSINFNYDLLGDDVGEEDQNIMVLALDSEYIDSISIPEDKLTRTDIILNFQIIFFNAKNNFLVAAIPLEITKIINSEKKLSKNEIQKYLKSIYENELVKYYSELLSKFEFKTKFKNRIGIKEVIFEEKAQEYFNKNFSKKDIFLKNRFAKSLSSYLAFNNDIAVVPYNQDRTTRTFMLKFQNSQREIKLPDPDYHIYLTIRGFKNILFKEGNIDEQWIYGSYVNIKIIQPDYPDEEKKIKINERFKNAINVELSKRSMKNKSSFEWIFYNDSLKMLFDNFSKQTIEIDKKWLKSANDNKKIVKTFKELKKVYDNCK